MKNRLILKHILLTSLASLLLIGCGGGGGGASGSNTDIASPVITSSNENLNIDENLDSSTVVYTVTATDYGSITYTISGTDAEYFTIDSQTGVVRLKESADYETKTSYTFIVEADDGINEPTTQEVTVNVNDLDDASPVITSGQTASIDENTDITTVIYTVEANDDADDTKTGTITYSISGTDAEYFTIDSQTGEVRLKESADYETKTSYTFIVEANDGVNDSTLLDVTVNVNDLDDTSPIITSSNEGLNIDENSDSSTVVYTVTATDSGTIIYSISGEDAEYLTIDSQTGEVRLIESADYETKTSYTFTVEAYDGINDPTLQDVTLIVNDLDDTSPVFTVVDPYIKNATFFYDENENGVQDDTELISTSSDENGQFTFTEEIPLGGHLIMIEKGEHNGVIYTGQLSGIVDELRIISPLGTFEKVYGNTVIVLEQAGLTIDETDIVNDPMQSDSVNHVIATLSMDTYLKLLDDNNVEKNSETLKNIIDLVKLLIANDITVVNIENSVSILDYLTSKLSLDGNLDELLNLINDSEYLSSAKDLLSNRVDSTQPAKLILKDGIFIIETAKKDSGLLDDVAIMFSLKPSIGVSTTLSLNYDETINDEITWEVYSKPDTSGLSVNVLGDGKSISFIPDVVGDYTILVQIANDEYISKKMINFNIKNTVSLEFQKVETFTINTVSKNLLQIPQGETINNYIEDATATDEEKAIGFVSNQSWVFSNTLSQSELNILISKYIGLTIIFYDEAKGVLVEYDNTDTTVLEQLESLKFEEGIDSIYLRIYEGEKAPKNFAIYPTEDSNNYSNNWHLAAVGINEAWEYSKGSKDLLIGVCDGGFDTNHTDLTNRFNSILTSNQSSHGMAVTGTIAANSDNELGISGINWESQVVASYMGLNYVNDVLSSSNKVKLVSNSWGYHLPNDFDPTNSTMVNDRFLWIQNTLNSYRHYVQNNSDRLFLWAAGNGVGNGLSYTGFYGCDTKFSNGAMHYSNSTLNKLDNLIIVSAFANQSQNSNINSEKTLVYYSDWGESADIAAPTEFDSLSLNNSKYSSFGGTSAATPVVSAVASLIMSINPKLTPKEVKEILINSATTYATKRYTDPYGNFETLSHPIPVLNAQEALKMAQATLDTNVNVVASQTDYFTPTLTLDYSSFNTLYKITSISSSVSSSSTLTGDYVDYGNQINVSTSSIEVNLDPDNRFNKITSTLTFEHLVTGDTFTTEHVYDFSYSDLTLNTVDSVTLNNLNNVELLIESLNSEDISISTSTDENGTLKLYLLGNDYKIRATLTGYNTTSKETSLLENTSQTLDMAMSTEDIVSVGSISGIVTDENGIPFSGVNVRISGGEQTNGYFASATTNENGYYQISNISKKDSNDNTITTFSMSASLLTYAEVIKANVIVLENIDRTENFTLVKETIISSEDYIFEDDFEEENETWTSTGMWHKINLSDNEIVNVNIEKGNVSLAPDDDSNGTLPNAASGSYAYWYGQDETGNFIGTEDGEISGGKSTLSTSGSLVSGEIVLNTNSDAVLRFNTWWEIESVNPNENGYDKMFVYVIKSDETEVLLKKLNPSVDPITDDRASKPFSSAGNYKMPVWSAEEYDLSQFNGETIKLKFYFDSVDSNYNGFRGWIIDNVRVLEKSILNN